MTSFQKSVWKASCQAFSPVVVNHCDVVCDIGENVCSIYISDVR